MLQTSTIRDFYQRIIGYVETDSVTGNKTGRDFYRRIVGYYNAADNTTRDFYRRIVGRGDLLVSLITTENDKQQRKS